MDRFEIPLDIEDVKIEQVKFTQNDEIIGSSRVLVESDTTVYHLSVLNFL
jgi:hypothetical protein